VAGAGISAVEPLCCNDRGLQIANVGWQVLALAQLNHLVILTGVWHIANLCWQVLALVQLNIYLILMGLVLAWLNLCVLLNGGSGG
jgi:hypothetical protein